VLTLGRSAVKATNSHVVHPAPHRIVDRPCAGSQGGRPAIADAMVETLLLLAWLALVLGAVLVLAD
jgi:hypothetical protein